MIRQSPVPLVVAGPVDEASRHKVIDDGVKTVNLWET